MASIHKRGKRWILYWREPTGRQRAKTFDRYKDAEEMRWKVEPLERRRLMPKVSPLMTVADYGRRWLRLVAKQVEGGTLVGYESVVRIHLAPPPLGVLRVAELRRGVVKEFLAEKLAGDLSTETVRRIHATLRAMLEWAVDDELLSENPARRLGKTLSLVRSKRQAQEEIRPFTVEERDRFHATAGETDTALAPLFFVMERGGLRMGEAIMLRVGDVHPERRLIRVERSIEANTRRVKQPKSGFGRDVEMSTELIERLAPILTGRKEEGLRHGDTSPLVFPSAAGTPYYHRNVERRFTRILERAGLDPRHTPHDLRHTFATVALERGVDVQTLQRWMGHASITTTVDLYGKHMKAHGRGQADLLDGAVENSSRGSRANARVSKRPVLLADARRPRRLRSGGSR